MDNLIKAIEKYEIAGEEVRNAAYVSFVDKREDIELEKGRQLRDRLLLSQLNGARAERAILEAVAISVARNKSLIK
jgi:hypothetical protein